MNIKTICILGAGTLGSRVALQSALSGYEVRIYDLTQKALDISLNTMKKILHQLVKAGQLDENTIPEVLERIEFTLDPKRDVEDADFIN